MSAPVGLLRPSFDIGAIKSGVPIRADTWAALGGLANWCHGLGSMIVPWYFVGITIASGATRTFRFNTQGKPVTVQRVWRVRVRKDKDGAGIDIAAPTGGTQTRFTPLGQTTNDYGDIFYLENLSAAPSGVQEISIDLEAVANDITIDAIACYEQARASINHTAQDDGVDITTLRPRQPILDRDYKSISGVCDLYDTLDARRTSLFQWAVPTQSAASTASTSAQNLFETPVPCIPARVVAASNPTLAVYAYVKATGGQITVAATSTEAGGSITNSTSGSSFAWLSVGNLSVMQEGFNEPDGLPGGTWETVNVTFKCDTATLAEIAGVSVIRTSTPI